MPTRSGSTSAGATPAQLVAMIENFIAEHPAAVLLEDGRILFDLRTARYTVSESHGRCIFQLWSDERNLVRTVTDAQPRIGSLRLTTRKMGAPKPVTLELATTRERRTPTTREAARRQYMRLLQRVLERNYPDWKQDGFRTAADLEHSFGPAYIRGQLLRGPAAEAIIGVSADESSSTIDGVLTLGLLWLDYCREHAATKTPPRHFGCLKVIVPAGTWRTTAERVAWLNPNAAAFQLFELNEATEELTQIDYRDLGNTDSRLSHAFDLPRALDRAQPGIARVMALIPAHAQSRIEIRARSAAEVGLLLHGLEFARIRNAAAKQSFAPIEEITFGAGANETQLNEETEPLARELFATLVSSRHPDGLKTDPLFRLQPERWLESRIRTELADFLPGLRGEFLYAQVPAIGSGERGMLDLLTIDRDRRLTILEVKAEEDMQLPLQGLDYWIRVRALNADRQPSGNRDTGAFERQGYFASEEISQRPPKLLLVAPALRIHPSNEVVLRYLSPEVDWELIAVSEHWRRDLKTVFRKRAT